MKLHFEYAYGGGGNQGFAYVFNGIYDKMSEIYPDIETTKVDVVSLFPICPHPGGRCGIGGMKITNPDTNKTTVLTFWDRSLEIAMCNGKKDGLGWHDFNIVHLIGGLGVYLNQEEIKEQFGILWSPFLYPLEKMYSYDFIEKYRHDYDPNKRVKKACFIGTLYEPRKQMAETLNKHPLFEVYSIHDGFHGENYYSKINEYALTLSFNGNGEFCLRDVESLGLGIPIVRSELKTSFYGDFSKDIHYIKGSDKSNDAAMYYSGYKVEEIAEQFIDSVEKVINDDDKLIQISKNGLDYYNANLKPEKIVDHFFKVFNLEILK